MKFSRYVAALTNLINYIYIEKAVFANNCDMKAKKVRANEISFALTFLISSSVSLACKVYEKEIGTKVVTRKF